MEESLKQYLKWHLNIQQNGIQHYDTQHNDVHDNNRKYNTKHIDITLSVVRLSVIYAECHN